MGADKVQKRVRCDYKNKVRLIVDSKNILIGESKNISLNGIYIETKEKLEIGTKCHVLIDLELSQPLISIEIKASIIRKDEAGVGLTFESMDSTSFEHLQKLVIYNAPHPEEVALQCKKHPGFK